MRKIKTATIAGYLCLIMTKDEIADQKRNVKAKALYERLFGRKWPKGWDIVWHVAGMTNYHDKRIYVCADSIRDKFDRETLLHELLHMHAPKMKHGPKFEATVRVLMKEAYGARK